MAAAACNPSCRQLIAQPKHSETGAPWAPVLFLALDTAADAIAPVKVSG